MRLKPSNETLYDETCQGLVDLVESQDYMLYTPWGEPAHELILKGYPFWYAFLLPNGVERRRELLIECFRESMQERAT